MTLQRLNEHLNMLLQLQAAKEALGSMKAQILGSANSDGMPHGHEVSRTTENLAILLQKQINDVNRLERMVESSEKEVREFVDSIEDNRTQLVFNLRYLCGLKWDAIPAFFGGGITTEGVKMVCYRYLERIGVTDCNAL